MKACLDVHYPGNQARAAALVFDAWDATVAAATYTATVGSIAAYEAGRFYLRELGPLWQ